MNFPALRLPALRWACLLLALGSFWTVRAAPRPNVLILLADEQGASDTLPSSLEALAHRGVRFTQFDAASSDYSASLQGLLTGRYPPRCGEKPDEKLPVSKMEDSFKAAGYVTGHASAEMEAEAFLGSTSSQAFLLYTELARPDQAIGPLLGKLDSLGLREKTIVVYQAARGHPDRPRTLAADSPVPGYFFESSIRVPAIISWPGHLPEGVVRNQWAHGFDWVPTLAELCGVDLQDWDIDGCSLVGVIQSDAPTPHAIMHWEICDGPHPQFAIRENDWKLMATLADVRGGPPTPPAPPYWLSNPQLDPTEAKDLTEENPQAASRLRSLQGYWQVGPWGTAGYHHP